jgi:hypothetical protein
VACLPACFPILSTLRVPTQGFPVEVLTRTERTQRIRRACLVLGSLAVRASQRALTAQALLPTVPQSMPRSRALRSPPRSLNSKARATSGEDTFRRVPMQFPLPATRRKRAACFHLIRHTKATYQNSTVVRCTTLSSPTFLDWFGISHPPSFPPSLGVLGGPDTGLLQHHTTMSVRGTNPRRAMTD